MEWVHHQKHAPWKDKKRETNDTMDGHSTREDMEEYNMTENISEKRMMTKAGQLLHEGGLWVRRWE